MRIESSDGSDRLALPRSGTNRARQQSRCVGLPLRAPGAMEASEWLYSMVPGLLRCSACGEVDADLMQLVALEPCHDLCSTYQSAIRTPWLLGVARLT
jgi:hypothetical protein